MMEKIFCCASSGLSEAVFPSGMSCTISLVVTVQGSCGSASFPSDPKTFLDFFPFRPVGRREERE